MTVLTIRRHSRFALKQSVRLLSDGKRPSAALLVEVSLDGGRLTMAGSSSLAQGEAVAIEVAGYGRLKAQICWTRNGLVGMRFIRPMHSADLEDLLEFCQVEVKAGDALRA